MSNRRPDVLAHPVADALRSGRVDDTDLLDLFNQMEAEIRVHRGTFCTDPSRTHQPPMEAAMRMFPIRLDAEIRQIPWAMLEEHREQFGLNHHGRLLEDLAAVGGITPEDALAVLEDRAYERMPLTSATLALKAHVERWLGVPELALAPFGADVPVFRTPAPAPSMAERLEHAHGLLERLRDGRAIPHKAHYNELLAIVEAAREALP